MPPEIPEPTTTKSTCLLGLKRAIGFLTFPARSGRFGVVVAERRLVVKFAVESDQLPTDLVPVAAVLRIRKEPGNRMRTDLREERRLFDRLEHLDLLLRIQATELRCAGKEFVCFGLKIA